MQRPVICLAIVALLATPAAALADDAGVSDAGVSDAAGAPVVHKKPATIDFGDSADGPSVDQPIKSHNPDTVKYKSLMPDKYKRTGTPTTSERRHRGRGCAGCSNTNQTTATALFLLLLLVVRRRY